MINLIHARRWMRIAWPAFLAACALEMLVFAFVDPQDLHWHGSPLTLSREGVYTFSFFAFWAIAAVSSALTTMLSLSRAEINGCPLPSPDRPLGCREP